MSFIDIKDPHQFMVIRSAESEKTRIQKVYSTYIENGLFTGLDDFARERLDMRTMELSKRNVYVLFYAGVAKMDISLIAELMYPDSTDLRHKEFELFKKARGVMYYPPADETEIVASSMHYLTNDDLGRICIKEDHHNICRIINIIEAPANPSPLPNNTLLGKIWLNTNVAYLTGEAGTGKTTKIIDICRALERAAWDKTVIVLAPTNLAVENVRIKITACPELNTLDVKFSTIHSFISRPSLNKDAHNFVIIDEASMMDGTLLLRVLNALTRSHSWKLLLVGDWRQLRPVNGSPIFRILLKSYPSHCIELTKNYRSDDAIIKNARLTLSDGTQTPITADEMLTTFIFDDKFKHVHSFDDIPFIEEKINNKTSLVITYKNVDVARLAIALHDRLNPDGPKTWKNNASWRVGDVILCDVTCRKRNIARNSSATITSIEEGYILANYHGREVRLTWSEFITRHVITVHKSQGQEADTVILYLAPSSEGYERDLIYTALTRAKSRIYIIFGSHD